MTPTPEQLAAVLPRVAAGINGGDWTDDAERLAWARRVLRYVEEATGGPSDLVRRSTGHTGANPGNWAPPPSWAIPTQPAPPAPGITYYGTEEAK